LKNNDPSIVLLSHKSNCKSSIITKFTILTDKSISLKDKNVARKNKILERQYFVKFPFKNVIDFEIDEMT